MQQYIESYLIYCNSIIKEEDVEEITIEECKYADEYRYPVKIEKCYTK